MGGNFFLYFLGTKMDSVTTKTYQTASYCICRIFGTNPLGPGDIEGGLYYQKSNIFICIIEVDLFYMFLVSLNLFLGIKMHFRCKLEYLSVKNEPKSSYFEINFESSTSSTRIWFNERYSIKVDIFSYPKMYNTWCFNFKFVWTIFPAHWGLKIS